MHAALILLLWTRIMSVIMNKPKKGLVESDESNLSSQSTPMRKEMTNDLHRYKKNSV